MLLWRISNYADLKGIGALTLPGRWHNAGKPAVYLSDHPASAMLEVIAHADSLNFPTAMQLLAINVSGLRPYVPRLPLFWRKDVEFSREVGDEWLASERSALMRIPSAIVPNAWNYVLNPNHVEASNAKIIKKQKFPVDERLK